MDEIYLRSNKHVSFKPSAIKRVAANWLKLCPLMDVMFVKFS